MNKKTSYVFRILAGAYLVYIGYSLIKKTQAASQASVGFLIAGILFAALGLCCCVTGILASYRADKKRREENADESRPASEHEKIEKSLEEQAVTEQEEEEE